jgi:16S rRNA (adenine1518-N6/adenine1519-N6)-dimethyltransferase
MQINEIKNFCNKLGVSPNKNLGQNFLLDEDVVKKMAEAAELTNNDTVLEIGPGFGVLTEELLPRVGRLIVVEKDKRLAEYLTKFKTQLTKPKNGFEIVNEDILKLSHGFMVSLFTSPNSLLIKEGSSTTETMKQLNNETMSYKIVANLPYQITSPILWKFLHEEPLKTTDPLQTSPLSRGRAYATRPELMVLMVQKEVGERICAAPGEMSVLSVMCQLYAECEFLFEVKRDKFYPVPEVDSAVIKLKLKTQSTKLKTTTFPKPPPYKGGELDERDFIRLVKFGFSARRKMLKNNLAAGLQIPMAKAVAMMKNIGLDEKIRAQELSVEEWIKLYKRLTTND